MPSTVAELIGRAKSEITNLDVDQTARAIADGALVIDIREADELQSTGAIPGALHVPRGLLEFKADPAAPTHLADLDPDERTILYCASGGRSALAVQVLQLLGYDDVAHLDGGIQAWIAADRPTELVD